MCVFTLMRIGVVGRSDVKLFGMFAQTNDNRSWTGPSLEFKLTKQLFEHTLNTHSKQNSLVYVNAHSK
jgi:hypothetical protein